MSEGPTRAPGRLLAIIVACVLIAALAFAIGRFTAFGASSAAPVPNAADAGFARDMQVHHAQAVEMAMIEYGRTTDADLRSLAYDIATGQSAQKGEMYDWLVQWGLPQSGEALMSWMVDAGGMAGHDGHATTGAGSVEELEAAMGMATDAELAALRDAQGIDADCTFLSLMIRHHEGAIAMVDRVRELGSVPRVIDVATSMAETQTAEVDAMRSFQARLACSG
ncbi:DUF305 domain-containing protein [Microbacterium sp. P02]|uniref:DUF305 domain-containing protein n=1 Tax=Microbacterium sp. P02 TaxID=3366260 RepID=UPI00366FD9C9